MENIITTNKIMTIGEKLCEPLGKFYIETSKELEEIADEYAIEFGQWMVSGVEFMDDTERGRVYYFKNKLYTTKELLEIYKKENGL